MLHETNRYGHSHLMKSYIDWIESNGASILVIPYDTPHIDLFFERINGLFIHGGDTLYIIKNKIFMKNIIRLFELSIQGNEYFPIWGTCCGFQLLMILFGNCTLSNHRSYQHTSIQLTEEGRNSRLFSHVSSTYLHQLENEKGTKHSHKLGISVNTFLKNPHLRRFYDILATSIDENGREYVASIEAKHYPIYGVTWHPEHDIKGNVFIHFFLSECKKNKHSSITMPPVNSYMKTHTCIQEYKKEDCYFF